MNLFIYQFNTFLSLLLIMRLKELRRALGGLSLPGKKLKNLQRASKTFSQ